MKPTQKPFLTSILTGLLLFEVSAAYGVKYDWGIWTKINNKRLGTESGYGFVVLSLVTTGIPFAGPPEDYVQYKPLFPDDDWVRGGSFYTQLDAPPGHSFQVNIDLTKYQINPNTIFGFSNVASTNSQSTNTLKYYLSAFKKDGVTPVSLDTWQFVGACVNSERPTEDSTVTISSSGLLVFDVVERGRDSKGHFWKVSSDTAWIRFEALPATGGGDGMFFYVGSPLKEIPVIWSSAVSLNHDFPMYWDMNYGNFDLEQSSLQPAATWEYVGIVPTMTNGTFNVVVPVSNSTCKFFRLKKRP